MMERLQPPAVAAAEPATEPVPASRDPARLPGLISEATLGPQDDRLRLAGEINALLEAMRAPGNEAAEARAVLQALELNSLEGLTDVNGKSCRAEAVETLMACGFPHALAVSPEDLEHLRDAQQSRAKNPGAIILFGVVLAAVLLLLGVALGTDLDALAGVLYAGLVIFGLVQKLARAAQSDGGSPRP